MADSDEDRLRALRARQQGGAYQEAPLPAAAQQKLAAAGAGRHIRSSGEAVPGAGPSRAVAEPAVRKDTATGKAVINLNTAVEQDTAAEVAKQSATNAKVHKDPRAVQSPLYSHSGPQSVPGKAGLGAATSSDTEWETQVKAVSAHIKEHHPHGGVGGVDVEYTGAGAPKPLSKDKITDLAERHLMGSARIPGLKSKSHEPGEVAPGLRVSPQAAAQSNVALKPPGGPGTVNLTTGNEAATPVPAKYQGKGRTPVKTTIATPAAPAAPAAPTRTPRDFSGMPSRSSVESRKGRRLERSAEYSENATPGQTKRDYYESNVPSANVTGSKTAQEVLHAERLSSPVNSGQFGRAANRITQAVHSGLSAQGPAESISQKQDEAIGRSASAPPPVSGDGTKASTQAPAPVHQEAVKSSPQMGSGITMLTRPGTKGVTPPHMASSAPDRMQLSPQQVNKARKSAPVAPPAASPTPTPSAPQVASSVAPPRPFRSTAPAPMSPEPSAPKKPEVVTSTASPEAPAMGRRPTPPSTPVAGAAPAAPQALAHTPKPSSDNDWLSAPKSYGSSVSSAPAAPKTTGGREAPAKTPAAAVTTSRQMGGGTVHHHHYYGSVNTGSGNQINVGGDFTGSIGEIHGGSGSSGSGRMPTGGGRGASVRPAPGRVQTHPVTGTPTGLQRAAYTALHTSVNGHSLAGAVEHVTGGGHIGMEDSAGRPIGHPADAFVQHHAANSPRQAQQSPVNAGQFNQARASRQQATP